MDILKKRLEDGVEEEEEEEEDLCYGREPLVVKSRHQHHEGPPSCWKLPYLVRKINYNIKKTFTHVKEKKGKLIN